MTATNEATNISDQAVTDEQGRYVFNKLQHNGVLEYTWSLTPNTIWTNRVGVAVLRPVRQ